MNPLGLSAGRADSLDMINLKPARKVAVGMNPMGLSSPWNEFLEMIDLHPVNTFMREKLNEPGVWSMRLVGYWRNGIGGGGLQVLCRRIKYEVTTM